MSARCWQSVATSLSVTAYQALLIATSRGGHERGLAGRVGRDERVGGEVLVAVGGGGVREFDRLFDVADREVAVVCLIEADGLRVAAAELDGGFRISGVDEAMEVGEVSGADFVFEDTERTSRYLSVLRPHTGVRFGHCSV